MRDEKQLSKIESLIQQGVSISQLSQEICVKPRATLDLLAKVDKTVHEYERKWPGLEPNRLLRAQSYA